MSKRFSGFEVTVVCLFAIVNSAFAARGICGFAASTCFVMEFRTAGGKMALRATATL